MEDHQYIKEIQEGKERALRLLYEKYSIQIFNTILTFVKQKESAEELLQDVFITVYDKAYDFKFNSAVSTWIYKIAINKSLDFLRKKKAKKRFGIFTAIYRKEETEPRPELVEKTNPGIQQEQKEEAKLLLKLINNLPEKQKVAFILTQVDGKTQKEVAEIMDISRKAVESLIRRAKDNLKKTLILHYPERGK